MQPVKKSSHHLFNVLLLSLFASLMLLVLFPAALQAQEQATGYVFHDKNENRTQDAGEPGIPGVAVSNGRQVVQTNENGRYELPVDNDDILFVVKPKGWMTPVNEYNLPRFYYIHKPKGSPNLKYAGTGPTGPLPKAVNFPLYQKNDVSDSFRTLLFGDTQPYSLEEVDYLSEDVISELVGIDNVAFGITMGDIVGNNLELFEPVNQAVAQIGIPWYNVLGNHDVNYDVETENLSDEAFERVYGPPTYAFTYGNAHFIVVDNVISPAKEKTYVGGLRKDQLTFVENYLETVPKDALIVLNMHIPLVKHGDSFRQSDQRKLFELLQAYPHTLSISAHTHMQEHKFFGEDAPGWQRPEPHHHFNLGTTSGSWWNGWKNETGIPHTMMRDGTPNGYAFLNIEGNDYTIDWKAAGRPASQQMNIHTSRPVPAGQSDTLTVNFFLGSERAEVSYRLDGEGPWQAMQQVEAVDPYYAALNQRWQHLKELAFTEQWKAHSLLQEKDLPTDGVPNAQPSSHLWKATLPADLGPGRHRVEVRVTDMFDRSFQDVYLFRVAAPENISGTVR